MTESQYDRANQIKRQIFGLQSRLKELQEYKLIFAKHIKNFDSDGWRQIGEYENLGDESIRKLIKPIADQFQQMIAQKFEQEVQKLQAEFNAL